MAWIRVETSLPTHRKTRRLAQLLGISRREASGLLLELFSWAGQGAVPYDGALSAGQSDGPSTGLSEEMSEAVGWKGESEQLLTALVDSGYVDLEDGIYRVHDWYDWNGKFAERRELDARRKRRTRGRPADRPVDSPADRPRVYGDGHGDGNKTDRSSAAARPSDSPVDGVMDLGGDFVDIQLTTEGHTALSGLLRASQHPGALGAEVRAIQQGMRPGLAPSTAALSLALVDMAAQGCAKGGAPMRAFVKRAIAELESSKGDPADPFQQAKAKLSDQEAPDAARA